MATDSRTLELEELEENLVHEIITAITNSEADCPALQEVQPPTSVVKLAAEAAAKVLMAFERGYEMGE